MKTKFEQNVAADIPKTRMSPEPGLPWKMDSDDLEKIGSMADEHKADMEGSSPFKVRAVFLAMLLAAVFATSVYFVSTAVIDNDRQRSLASQKEAAVVAMRTDLDRASSENAVLTQSRSQLERQVKDLNKQKELYTTVIESLSKRPDEPIAPKNNGDEIITFQEAITKQ